MKPVASFLRAGCQKVMSDAAAQEGRRRIVAGGGILYRARA